MSLKIIETGFETMKQEWWDDFLYRERINTWRDTKGFIKYKNLIIQLYIFQMESKPKNQKISSLARL